MRAALLLTISMIFGLVVPASAQQRIAVQIKGYDDGVKSTAGQDYEEAVLFAKREAIERAGVSVRSLTTMKDFVVKSDYIETQAEAVLEPGYDILDIGYQSDGSYLIILTGTISSRSDKPGKSKDAIESPLLKGLNLLAESHNEYEYDLGELGTYAITKAYFANASQFVVHYDYRNGVMTLNNIDKGIMQLDGTYRTDTDSGSVVMDFNSDGTARGQWKFFLSSGEIKIQKKQSAEHY